MTQDAPRPETRRAETEADLLSRLREQYATEGYQASTTLPIEKNDPLSAYRPDLVLRKGSDVIVVELKRSIETRDTEGLRKLRSQIESHPGWHLRVLFVGDPFQAPPMTVRSDSKSTLEIGRRISDARALLERGDYVGAITFLWIAVEAALRVYFSKSGELPTTGVTALSMLRRLYEDGTVTETDYNILAQGYQLRNNIVHGFNVQITKSVAASMLKIAESLIQSLRESTAGR